MKVSGGDGSRSSPGSEAARMEVHTPISAPNCLKCRHFYVTWDRRFPRGCRVFGIKSRGMPSESVFRATGRHCPAFEKAPNLKD